MHGIKGLAVAVSQSLSPSAEKGCQLHSKRVHSMSVAAIHRHVDRVRSALLPRVDASSLDRDVRESATARFLWEILDPLSIAVALLAVSATLGLCAFRESDASAAKGAYLGALRATGTLTVLVVVSVYALSGTQAALRRKRAVAPAPAPAPAPGPRG